MSIHRPYRRTCRQFVDGSYTDGDRWMYMIHPRFSQSPGRNIQAFLLLLKDLQEIFDYIEPADKNLACYSYRTHALLIRACVEFEANCKAILKENGYTKDLDLNISDYKKINATHRLSSYQVKAPNWNGSKNMRSPFTAWAMGGVLPWYEAYSMTKHDRHATFEKATFEHLVDACCGVLVILSAQFETNNFIPGSKHIVWGEPDDGMENGIGDYFRVKFPTDWPQELRYDFNWREVEMEEDPFQTFDYSTIT
jgi:hypothetical protein